MTESLETAITQIKGWLEIKVGDEIFFRGSTKFIPFIRFAICAQEREFEELKNDFGWNKMPFSKLEQNTVFLLIMGMCKNLFVHVIIKFSEKRKLLSPHFRIKKFIFRFSVSQLNGSLQDAPPQAKALWSTFNVIISALITSNQLCYFEIAEQ